MSPTHPQAPSPSPSPAPGSAPAAPGLEPGAAAAPDGAPAMAHASGPVQPYPPMITHPAPHAGPAPVPLTGPAPAVDPRARTAGILLLACALALLLGLGSKSWFTGRGGSSLGVLGIEECRGMVCHSISWLDAKRAPGEIQAFSVMALLGGLAGIGFLIHAGVVLLMGNPRKVLLRGLNISLGIAAFGIVSFFFRFSVGEYSRGVSVSWAGLLAVASVIGAAILLPVMVRPLSRAAAALPPGPAPQPAAVPPGAYPPPA